MSGIDICDLSLLTDNDMQIALDKAEAMARSKPVRNIDEIVLSFTAEIRRLRAENKELRASYERVEKYGQILLIETGELKDELSLWKRNADR